MKPSRPLIAARAETSLRGRATPVSRKAELLAEAARQFCLKPRPGPQDISEFKEFFYQLIDGCGKEERRALAASLATNPYVPRPVVLYLALDDKEIAAPILLFSPVLNEADIVPLAARLSLGHLHVLCRRADLTPAAAEALIVNGGRSAALILSRNVATTGLAEVQAAAKAGSSGAAVRSPAPDNEPGLVRRQMLEMARRGGRLGRRAGPATATEAARAAPRQKSAPAPIAGEALESRLVGLARAGEPAALGGAIAQVCGLPERTVARLLGEAEIEAVCVLFKGIGLSGRAAGRLILEICPQIGRDRGALAAAIRTFDQLDAEQCRAFIGSLDEMPTADTVPSDAAPGDAVPADAAERAAPTPAVAAEPVPTAASAPPAAAPRTREAPVQATPVRREAKRPAAEAPSDPAEAGDAFARAIAERRREIARPGPATRGGRIPGSRRMFGRIKRAG